METTPTAERSVREAKIRASILLKDLRSRDPVRVERSAACLRRIDRFSDLPSERMVALRDEIRRKHALDAVALEWGYGSWIELRVALNETGASEIDTESFFREANAFFLNRWFKRYEEARESLATEGGFLFPFRSQFFICEAALLEWLGVDAADSDWQRIGFNWVEPADPEARERLAERLVALGLAA